MRYIIKGLLIAGWLALAPLPVLAEASSANPYAKFAPAGCDLSRTTICTMEVWLEYKHQKNRKALKKILKDRSIKVLRNTFQFWKPRGGHPPTNIAIGRGLSAEDARWVIEFALRHNDNVDGLILQRLNPPFYVAVATSAWDENSEAKISPEQLEQLRNPELSTEEFHKLYVSLTNEQNIPEAFY